jgi:hypothetical protein
LVVVVVLGYQHLSSIIIPVLRLIASGNHGMRGIGIAMFRMKARRLSRVDIGAKEGNL